MSCHGQLNALDSKITDVLGKGNWCKGKVFNWGYRLLIFLFLTSQRIEKREFHVKKQNMWFLNPKYVKMLFLAKYVKKYVICDSHFFPNSSHDSHFSAKEIVDGAFASFSYFWCCCGLVFGTAQISEEKLELRWQQLTLGLCKSARSSLVAVFYPFFLACKGRREKRVGNSLLFCRSNARETIGLREFKGRERGERERERERV